MKACIIAAMRADATRKCRLPLGERGREMTLEEAADYLRMKKGTIQNWISCKEVPAYKFMRHVVFFENELKRYKDLMMVPN